MSRIALVNTSNAYRPVCSTPVETAFVSSAFDIPGFISVNDRGIGGTGGTGSDLGVSEPPRTADDDRLFLDVRFRGDPETAKAVLVALRLRGDCDIELGDSERLLGWPAGKTSSQISSSSTVSSGRRLLGEE